MEGFGPERWAIWNDSSLTWDEKSAQLENTGLDVSTIIAMAILGGVAKIGGKGPVYRSNKEAKIAAEALGLKK